MLGIANGKPLFGVFVLLVHGGTSHARVNKVFFFLVFSRGWQRHIYYYTKKPGLSPALSKPFYFIFISLGLCLFFRLNVNRKTPFFNEASAEDRSAFSGTS